MIARCALRSFLVPWGLITFGISTAYVFFCSLNGQFPPPFPPPPPHDLRLLGIFVSLVLGFGSWIGWLLFSGCIKEAREAEGGLAILEKVYDIEQEPGEKVTLVYRGVFSEPHRVVLEGIVALVVGLPSLGVLISVPVALTTSDVDVSMGDRMGVALVFLPVGLVFLVYTLSRLWRNLLFPHFHRERIVIRGGKEITLTHGKSSLVFHVCSYPEDPVRAPDGILALTQGEDEQELLLCSELENVVLREFCHPT